LGIFASLQAGQPKADDDRKLMMSETPAQYSQSHHLRNINSLDVPARRRIQ